MKDETGTIVGMHQTRRQNPGQDDEQDYEIDLRKYISVAIKRKALVLAIFASAVLIAVIRAIAAPKVYEVSTLIAPPIVAVTEAGPQELDTVANMKAQIESGAYNDKVINGLNIDVGPLKFSGTPSKDLKAMKVSLTQTADKIDLGKNILTALIEAMNLNYAKSIEDKRSRIGSQIKQARDQVVRKENELKMKDSQFKILSERELQCVVDLKEVNSEMDKLHSERAHVFEQSGNKEVGATLLYTAVMQQNLIYSSQLRAELTEIRIQKFNILNAADSLKSGLIDDRIGMENLKLSKEALHNIVVLQKPLVSPRPAGPRKEGDILFAAVAGLMLGLFAAFSIEYWERSPA